MQTIKDYLNSGVIDITPLLSLVLNKSTTTLISHTEYTLNTQQKNQLDLLIKQRQSGIPFAYLSGEKGFYHLNFKVTTDTLIPRPETELLIDITLDLFQNKPCNLLDLGTGSGIIAITLADKNPHWQVSATDFSHSALEVAKTNATTDINFIQGNWFAAVPNQTFDLIICNPPYIEENDPHLDPLRHEPLSALSAGADGLDDIKIIINHAPNHLQQSGYLLLEHGHTQRAKIVNLLAADFHLIQTFADYNNQDRAILAQLKG